MNSERCRPRFFRYRIVSAKIRYSATVLTALTFLCGCSGHTLQRSLVKPEQIQSLDGNSPFLKVHMRDGRVYILSSWTVDQETPTVTGSGDVLSVNRDVVETGQFRISIDSVAIFETNVVQSSPGVAALAVITGVSVALTTHCLANPKSCFGSCPTFYVSDGDQRILAAEGFSASVAPSLEAVDIDALHSAEPAGSRFEIRMKNEALETHVVRYAHLLAVERLSGGGVFATAEGAFWGTGTSVAPSAAFGPEGDCLAALQGIDGHERFSEADSGNLAQRETLEIAFDTVPDGGTGVVIAARQTLLSTFLFYQALAYMGRSAGEWTAALEKGDNGLQRQMTFDHLLGGIEVFLQEDRGKWVSIGEINESGPLATDIHLVKLPHVERKRLKMRLRLTRGHWRLDAVGLVELGRQLSPMRLRPDEVHRNGIDDPRAKQLLAGTDAVLTAFPGDVYTLVYHLPEDFERYELFLESRGYYLEWIREEWLADENPALAAMMLFNPGSALRLLAPEFKKVEATMEELFWNSRYELSQ